MMASVRLNYGKQTRYIKYAIYSLPIRHHNPAIQKRTLSSQVRLFFVTGIFLWIIIGKTLKIDYRRFYKHS
ncbi:hypothetical protein CBG25_19525 [Arsenophonus sp. ENCA]|nr:hypothetical protein CBG25_19525 [Arsenophonus sp. ENCA]